jgi:hypothetical protein
MSTDRETGVEVRPRCWSYSPQGLRCEGDAGHTDRHVVRSLWSDEEAWAPGAPSPAPRALSGAPAAPQPAPVEPTDCEKCGHPMESHIDIGSGVECALVDCDCTG